MTEAALTHNLAPSAQVKFLTRVLPLILLALVLALIPVLGPSRTAYTLLNAICINVVFALSYNMLLGQAGLLSFGHAVYFGLGGYAALHAMVAIEEATYGDPSFWGSVPIFALPAIGFAGGALAGALIGWPSCRRAGTPFAMISLGIAELVAAAGYMFTSIFGGEEGVTADRVSGPELFGLTMGPIDEVYIFIAVWTWIAVLAMYAFTRTPMGRLTQACRDNDERVQYIGYDAHKIRYITFILSGGFAGLAGGMAAVNYEIFTPEALGLIPSGFVLLMAFIGGARFFWGPLLGAILLTLAQSNLSDYSDGWLLYLGVMFIVMVIWAPAGLAGIVVATFRRGKTQLGGDMIRLVCALIAFAGFVIAVELLNGEAHEPALKIFGLALPADSARSWIVVAGCLALGIGGLRRLSRGAQK
ncbi:branched-chain amino acid ABC transporter permease [Halovulum sp. GXIMD14793]